jgi:hypothetical protein
MKIAWCICFAKLNSNQWCNLREFFDLFLSPLEENPSSSLSPKLFSPAKILVSFFSLSILTRNSCFSFLSSLMQSNIVLKWRQNNLNIFFRRFFYANTFQRICRNGFDQRDCNMISEFNQKRRIDRRFH